MRTERRPAPSSPSRTTGTSAPTDRTTVTAATPRFIPRRAPSPTRRRTACRAHLRCARPSRNGLSAKQLELGAAPGRRSRLRGPPSRSRRATTIVTTRRPNGRPKARTLRDRRSNQPPNGRDRRRSAARSATTAPRPCRRGGTRRGTGRRRRRGPPDRDEQWSGRGRSAGAAAARRRSGRRGGRSRRSRDATTAVPCRARGTRARRQHGRSRGRWRIVRRPAAPAAGRGAEERRAAG